MRPLQQVFSKRQFQMLTVDRRMDARAYRQSARQLASPVPPSQLWDLHMTFQVFFNCELIMMLHLILITRLNSIVLEHAPSYLSCGIQCFCYLTEFKHTVLKWSQFYIRSSAYLPWVTLLRFTFTFCHSMKCYVKIFTLSCHLQD